MGRRSRLPSLKQLRTIEPTGTGSVKSHGVGCVLRVSPFMIYVLYQGFEYTSLTLSCVNLFGAITVERCSSDRTLLMSSFRRVYAGVVFRVVRCAAR